MNFGRVVRMAIRYKFTFAASVVFGADGGRSLGGEHRHPLSGRRGDLPEQVDAAMGRREDRGNRVDGRPRSRPSWTRLRRQLAAADKDGDEEPGGTSNRASRNARTDRDSRLTGRCGRTVAKPYIDRYLPDSPFHTLLLITGLLVVGTRVQRRVPGGQQRAGGAAGAAGHVFDLRKLFYRRTLRMDLATFGEDGTADLMSRFTNDMSQVAGGLDSLFGKLIREPLKMFACLAGAAYSVWRLLLLTLIVTPVAGFPIRWLAKMLKRANRRAMEEMAVIYTTLEETFRSIKIVKAFTNERQERRRFHDDNKRYLHKAMRIARYDSLTHPMTEVLGIATISLVMIVGGWLIFSPETSLLGIRMSDGPLGRADMLTFFAMLAGMADPLAEDVRHFQQFAGRLCRRRPDFRPARPRAAGPRSRKRRPLPSATAAIWRSRTSASPISPASRCCEEVNLRIAFGETIAIVGPNGCGKSTLANLIPRFADPTGRRGQARRRAALRRCGCAIFAARSGWSRRRRCSSTTRFSTTSATARPQATREQVIEAAKQAHAHRFIEQRTARRLRDLGRGAGQSALGRPAAADRPGPGHPPRSGHPDPRRGHQPGRSGERAGDPAGAGEVHPRPHHDPHHAPPGRAVAGRSDRGDGRRAGFSTSAATTNCWPAAASTAGCTRSISRI